MKQVSAAQVNKAFRAISNQFSGWFEDPQNGPQVMQYQGYTAIVWEGGPYGWVHLARYGGIEEEFGTTIKPAPESAWPKGVWFEALDNVAIALMPE